MGNSSKKSMDKKGLISDVFGLTFGFFVLAVGLVLVWIVLSNINTAVKDIDNSTVSQSAKENYTQYADDFTSIWDNVFLITFIGITIAGMVFLFFLNTTVVIWFLIWFVSMIILYFASALANNYARIATSDGVAQYASQFTYIPFILNHYLEIMVVITVLYSIIFFVKNQSGGVR